METAGVVACARQTALVYVGVAFYPVVPAAGVTFSLRVCFAAVAARRGAKSVSSLAQGWVLAVAEVWVAGYPVAVVSARADVGAATPVVEAGGAALDVDTWAYTLVDTHHVGDRVAAGGGR